MPTTQAPGQLAGPTRQGFQTKTSVSSIAGDIASCNQRFAAYLEKLQQLAHKLEGPQPTPPAANEQPSRTVDSVIADLDVTRMTYSRLLDEMERLLGSLENAL